MLRGILLIWGACALAVLSFWLKDRWLFARQHGQAALDAQDLALSEADDASRQPARVIPIEAGHRRLVERPRTYPKAARIRQREHGGAA